MPTPTGVRVRFEMTTKLDDIKVFDEKGASTRLGELWKERPAVLVFVRHFG